MSCSDVQTIKAGNGQQTFFSFNFPYIFKSEIHVYFWNATTKEYDEILTTDNTYPWRITDANPTIVEFTGTAPPSPAAVTDPGETSVDNIKIRRITNVDDIRALFNPGSAIRSDDLNRNFEQLRYAIQESNCQGIPDDVDQYLRDYYWDRFDNTSYGTSWQSDDTQIATTAAVDNRIDNKIDTAINTDILVDTATGLYKNASGGQVSIGIQQNAVDFDRIKDSDTIDYNEQRNKSVTPTDHNIFTASAIAERHDNFVQTGTPANPSDDGHQHGKLWFRNDNEKTLYIWRDDGGGNGSWLGITSGGTFTRLEKVIYVDKENGEDSNDGNRISTPMATIKAAVNSANSDSTYGPGTVILVSPGIYEEVAPIVIDQNDISIIGTSIRNVIVHPTVGTEENNLFEVNSGTYLSNMTFTGVKASGVRGAAGSLWPDSTYGLPPNQGWNVAFKQGATILKSPYIQNCTNFSDSEIANSTLGNNNGAAWYQGGANAGRAGDLDHEPTGGGLCIDGSVVDSNSPLRSMVADSYTHTALDGPGIFVTNNGYCQATSSYAFFNHFHIACLNGGQANLAASTSDFGRFSLIASGKSTSTIFTATPQVAAAINDTTIQINTPTASSGWHGSATRPASNMLLEVGGNLYPILSTTEITNGYEVTISRPDTNDRQTNLGFSTAVATTDTVNFYLRSMIASSGHTMEYVGAGLDYRALPENASGTYTLGSGTSPNGVPQESHQKVELDDGKVWAAITDHNGKFRVGDTFSVNQQTGLVEIPAGALGISTLIENLNVNGQEIVSSSDGNIVLNPDGNGVVDVSTSRIQNVVNPTNDQDAATKKYVDDKEVSNIAADAVDSDEIADGAIDTIHIADDQVTYAKLQNLGTANRVLGGATANGDIAEVQVATDMIADDAVTATKIADGTITTTQISDSTLVISSEVAALTTSNDSTIFTTGASDARYFRQDSTETITSGVTWSSADTHVATTGAINARIVDLLDNIGGFVPIANETSFPTTNPDTNNGSGTIVSIASLTNSHTHSGGTVTISNGAGTGNTVTITGCPDLPAGFGVLVETTTTLHTYTFHRIVPAATEVTTVATNITDVNTVANDLNNTDTIGTVATDLTGTNTVGTVAGDITGNGHISTVAGSISDVGQVATNISSVTTVATSLNSNTNIATVAGDIQNVNAVAGKATEIGRLGTADAVADMNTLGTADVVADMNTLATADVVADMNTLATADVVADMNTLGTADVVSDMNTLATSANVTNMDTCATDIANINTVAGNITDVNTFANRYRISASAPTTSLDDGDLWWDSTNDALMVYDATSSSWVGGVTNTSAFLLKSGGTMTGQITASGDPTLDDHLARKAYVDTTIDSKIDTALTTDVIGTTNSIDVTDDSPNSGQITLSVAASGVTTGNYTYSNISVGSDGRITSASNGGGDTALSFNSADANATPKLTFGDDSNLEIYYDNTGSTPRSVIHNVAKYPDSLYQNVSTVGDYGLLIKGDVTDSGSNEKAIKFEGTCRFADPITVGQSITADALIIGGVPNPTSGTYRIIYGASANNDPSLTYYSGTNELKLDYGTTTGDIIIETYDGSIKLDHDGTTTLQTTDTGVTVTGILSDSAGNVRTIPQLSRPSNYTWNSADVGKHVSLGGTFTIPTGLSIGDTISIYNSSTSNATIDASAVTLYQAGTTNTGNRTLAQHGVATILCVGTNTFVVSGAGLS